MEEEEKKELKRKKGGLGINENISECLKISATQTASEKVTNMVGTFLKEDSTESLFKRAIGYSY